MTAPTRLLDAALLRMKQAVTSLLEARLYEEAAELSELIKRLEAKR